MEGYRIALRGRTAIALDAAALDKLLGLRSGDAALLYLHLLRREGEAGDAAERLGFSEKRLSDALTALQGADLIAREATSPPAPAPEEEMPEYTAGELTEALTGDPMLAGLMNDLQQRLGKVLSTEQMKIVYGLYDHLSFPAEVISLLAAYCIEERRGRDGTGPMPTMRQIEREGFRWRRAGVDSLERAEEHLRRLLLHRSKRGAILVAVGITERAPVASEQKYIDAWIDMGFEAEAVAIAYDRTVLKTGGLKWPYLSSILKSWHEKGLHTPAQIEAGDLPPEREARRGAPAGPGGAGSGSGTTADLAAVAWMRDYVKNKREGANHGA